MAKQKQQQDNENDTVPVSAYLPAEMVEQIDAQADAEGRKRSQMVRRLIEEALTAREQLAAVK